jgi:hypothetical protein
LTTVDWLVVNLTTRLLARGQFDRKALANLVTVLCLLVISHTTEYKFLDIIQSGGNGTKWTNLR